MQNKLKRYRDYKPSGVEWLGEIPYHWDKNRLKYHVLFSENNMDVKNYDTFIGLENIESWTGKLLSKSEKDNIEGTFKKFEAKNVLFGKLRPYLAKVVYPNFSGICTTELLILKPKKSLNGKYLFYLLISYGFIKVVDSMTYGTKMPRTNTYQIGHVIIPIPPLQKQQAIANFLDRETAKIDELAGKYRRLIELLQEKRSALITQAVTRGLDPSAPLKDSGVEWLGEIPSHWYLKKVKHIAWFNYGESLSENNRQDGNISVYGSNGVVGFHNKSNTLSPCIIIGRKGSFGKINYCIDKCYSIDTTFFIDNRACKDNLRWLFYTLQILKLDDFSRDSAVPGLSRDEAHNRPIPYPTLTEQQAIADFLDRETAKIDDLISKIETMLARLNEYRSALIAAEVTGKIDVRED